MLLSLAWRNLWRNARRTGTTVAAMTLAVVALIFYYAWRMAKIDREYGVEED